MSNYLEEIRTDWAETIGANGGHCPCCDRWGKVYGRTINQTMARAAAWLASHTADGSWVDVPEMAPRWLLRSSQLTILRWWGLIEGQQNDDTKKRSSGKWRITRLGLDWVKGKAQVHQKAFTYNNRVVRFEGPLISISDCMGEFFDYSQMMPPLEEHDE
jgi:hypothetical protein